MMSWPVVNAAPGELSQSTALAISSGVPMRPADAATDPIDVGRFEQVSDHDLRTHFAQRVRAFVFISHHRAHRLALLQQQFGDRAPLSRRRGPPRRDQNGSCHVFSSSCVECGRRSPVHHYPLLGHDVRQEPSCHVCGASGVDQLRRDVVRRRLVELLPVRNQACSWQNERIGDWLCPGPVRRQRRYRAAA